MELLRTVNWILGALFVLCYAYQYVYLAVPFLKKTPPPPKTEPKNRYAVLIAARNEEAVIGKLLDSLHRQTYPGRLITVFVAADNCTDKTAERARQAGAVVYERQNRVQIGKGYALRYLTDCIRRDCPGNVFDGYFVFDADNLLDEHYVEEMDRTFRAGNCGILASYRNSKNYGDNWISAGYALWFLRDSRFLNHSRQLLEVNCTVSGTGFLFSRTVMEKNNGWNCFLLTEDTEFTVRSTLAGEKIGYCPRAVFYDEQPTGLKQSFRQRLRWAKGFYQVMGRHGKALAGKCLKGSFSCFDHLMSILPAALLSMLGMGVNLISTVLGIASGNGSAALFAAGGIVGSAYLTLFVVGAVTTLSEWHSICAPAGKKIGYTFTFPLFMLTYIPISLAALFCRVEWKPIEHRCALNVEQVRDALPPRV